MVFGSNHQSSPRIPFFLQLVRLLIDVLDDWLIDTLIDWLMGAIINSTQEFLLQRSSNVDWLVFSSERPASSSIWSNHPRHNHHYVSRASFCSFPVVNNVVMLCWEWVGTESVRLLMCFGGLVAFRFPEENCFHLFIGKVVWQHLCRSSFDGFPHLKGNDTQVNIV